MNTGKEDTVPLTWGAVDLEEVKRIMNTCDLCPEQKNRVRFIKKSKYLSTGLVVFPDKNAALSFAAMARFLNKSTVWPTKSGRSMLKRKWVGLKVFIKKLKGRRLRG
jgi:hypothetical protein